MKPTTEKPVFEQLNKAFADSHKLEPSYDKISKGIPTETPSIQLSFDLFPSFTVTHNEEGDFPTLGELTDRYSDFILQVCKGNKTEAARVLGIDRRTFYRRIERNGKTRQGEVTIPNKEEG